MRGVTRPCLEQLRKKLLQSYRTITAALSFVATQPIDQHRSFRVEDFVELRLRNRQPVPVCASLSVPGVPSAQKKERAQN
eukprot:3589652-Prymnesium_polylepis.1